MESFPSRNESQGIFKQDDNSLSGNLTSFDYHSGYWINTDDCDGESCEHTLTFNGFKVTDNVTYPLEDGNNLIGGLYGVHIKSCFFGESMFSKVTNASKHCLLFLISKLLLTNLKVGM